MTETATRPGYWCTNDDCDREQMSAGDAMLHESESGHETAPYRCDAEGCKKPVSAPGRCDEHEIEQEPELVTDGGVDQSEAATHQTINNRPARVDAVYSDVAKVRWQDNNTRGYVAVEDLGREVA